jgi:GDP-L-fucose synthase
MKYKKVLVTGGSGFIGTNLKLYRPDWFYPDSKNCNLLDLQSTLECFREYKPDAIVHLGARVGGIKANSENQSKFFEDNVRININVITAAKTVGINRVLASISTCAYPDLPYSETDKYGFVHPNYPLKEEDIFRGPPTKTNFSYGYAKRMLYVHTLSCREDGFNYNCFAPSNVYGPHDNFDLETGHFVPSLIAKVAAASEKDKIKMWGTGAPKRQQMFVKDLVEIIPQLLEKHNGAEPLLVCPEENETIGVLSEILIKQTNKNICVDYHGELEGQLRKDGGNRRLKEIIGDYSFTPFAKGVIETYNWYKNANSNS